MATAHVTSSGSPGFDEDQFATFRKDFKGSLIQPEDPEYDRARKIWNGSIDKRPLIIARCQEIADVVLAVRFARKHNLLMAIRGGGHNVGGRALCDEGLVVDLTEMRGVSVDPKTKTVTAQGGALLGDLDRETHNFGLAVPAGVMSRTGVAGLTLGGGVGWSVRKYGMTIDNVQSFEVVTATGDVVMASIDENPDLFWALRGGGGNFGVVTSFRFRAHPVSTVLAGPLVYSSSKAFDLLCFVRNFMSTAPDELTVYIALQQSPEGMPIAVALCCYCGEPGEGLKVVGALKQFGTPLFDGIQEMPHPALQSMLDQAFPDGSHYYWKSSLHKDLNEDAMRAIVEQAYRMPSPLSVVVVEYYGGAAGRVRSSETAFPHRQSPWDVIASAQWTDPAESPQNRAWARGLTEALQPFSSGAHLLGALDEEPQDVVNSAFGGNLPRLSEIKKKYDPTNFFRVNQNIQPAS